MPKKTTMTEKIYEYLQKIIPEQGYAPSVREIGDAVGLRSPSTVHFHLKRLQEQGLIEKGDFKGRALVLTHRTEKNQIPILGNVAAGTPILAQECIEDYLTFDCNGDEQSFFALRVRGDSMLGAGILPGDLVVVHRQQTASSGDIVVALLEDEATVKRLSHRDGGIWLLPENPNYQPIDGTHAALMGKVTAVVRRYN
ncbi:MAG: transcriptional repressor LexA [Oscillospiraceae bacterium]|nr:transcriptional repressor LexA [Oscillospiraceae bacterium]